MVTFLNIQIKIEASLGRQEGSTIFHIASLSFCVGSESTEAVEYIKDNIENKISLFLVEVIL